MKIYLQETAAGSITIILRESSGVQEKIILLVNWRGDPLIVIRKCNFRCLRSNHEPLRVLKPSDRSPADENNRQCTGTYS